MKNPNGLQTAKCGLYWRWCELCKNCVVEGILTMSEEEEQAEKELSASIGFFEKMITPNENKEWICNIPSCELKPCYEYSKDRPMVCTKKKAKPDFNHSQKG